MTEERRYRSKGGGRDLNGLLAGEGVVLEDGVRIFHLANVELGARVYVGHDTILEGYHKEKMRIGDGTWIGPQCFFHSAGGLTIGKNVGIGAGVRILTSFHQEAGRAIPILHAPLTFGKVVIEDHVDIGLSAVILPGVTIGRGAQVGAGAVVTKDVTPYAVVAGSPARELRKRPHD